MTEEKTAAVEAEETSTATDETKEEASTLAKEVAEKIVPFAREKTEPKSKEEASEPLAKEDTSTAEETEEKEKTAETEEAESAELEEKETVEEEVKELSKSKVQRRIDALTAKNKTLEEQIAKLDSPKKERTYTKEELRSAMKKAHAEGDTDLMMDIMDYQTEQIESRLVKKYEDEQKRIQDQAKQTTKEWTDVRESYEYLADEEEAELYPNSRKELNIRDHSSLLYQLALALYNGYTSGGEEPDEELKAYYRKSGGQKLAVADALTQILKKRRGLKTEDKEKKLLKKKLVKAKRRSSLATEGAVKKEETSKPKFYATDKERLSDYIKGRKKRQAEAVEALLDVK